MNPVVIALVVILGLSMIGLGQMSSYGDNNNSNWYNNFWNFDFKKFSGFLNSGGFGGNNNDDDDHDDDHDGDDHDDDHDDDDHDGDHVDQSPIDSASVAFHVGIRELNIDGQKSFQNVVDQCIFHSQDSFSPLCVKCELLDKSGKVVGKGELIKKDKSYKASDSIPIPVLPVSSGVPASNDVQDVEGVNLVICGFKDKCEDHDKCKCDERKKDHKKHYDDFDKYYKDNKNKFGKGDHSKFMKDYESYFDENGKYMDKYDYKMFMDYHEKFLKDNKKYFTDSDNKRYSDKHKKYSYDYPKHHEKCDCHGDKEDHKKHYDDFDKYYKFNKHKFSKSDYSKFMKDYEDYFDEKRKYMDSSEYKMFSDYHEKFLKDNKKYFSSDDYKHHSDEHDKYSKDYKKHQDDDDEDECKEKTGFFTGGGKVKFGTTRVTHGFELHCDANLAPNNLEVNWLQNKFHLEELEKANCIDDGTQNEPPPSPHPGPTLDVYNGEGYGRYNGQCGAYAIWSMEDNGEPGKNDTILSLVIKDKDGNEVLNINNPLKLYSGNHQFVPHPSTHPNPPTQTNPCPQMTP